jgi:hypothetical protein
MTSPPSPPSGHGTEAQANREPSAENLIWPPALSSVTTRTGWPPPDGTRQIPRWRQPSGPDRLKYTVERSGVIPTA